MFGLSSYHGGARRARRPGRAGGAVATPAFVPAACAAERLEGRLLLAAFTVTTPADAGPGSLRQAMLDANATPGADTIGFAIPGTPGTVHTIRPLSGLPVITDPVTIDATTQPGYAGTPLIELDGSAARGAHGFAVHARPTTIRGFAINRFAYEGIRVTAPLSTPARPVFIEANHIGTDPSGEVALPNDLGGVRIDAMMVRVGGFEPAQRNVISGNRGPGVRVNGMGYGGPDTSSVDGNYIGTNRRGDRALGNGHYGIEVGSGPVYVGANVISGNGYSGVFASGSTASPRLAANYVGTDARGAAAIPNGVAGAAPHRDGVTVTQGAEVSLSAYSPLPEQRTRRNVISGNRGSGIYAEGGAHASIGNAYIGTDATGSYAIGNGLDGVTGRSSYVGFGGSVISGNGRDGVRLESMVGDQNTYLRNNTIGLNAAGTAAVGNGGNGITLIN